MASDRPLVFFALLLLAAPLLLAAFFHIRKNPAGTTTGSCETIADAGHSDEVGTCMLFGCKAMRGDTTCVRNTMHTKARCVCTNGWLDNGNKVCAAPTTCVDNDVALSLSSIVAAPNPKAAKQREYELNLAESSQVSTKSKVSLSIIYLFGLNVCGIDRCFMGQVCLGTVKGLTIGGLGIWALIDWIVILINMLKKETSIDSLGFHGVFDAAGVDTAFYITIAGLVLHFISSAGGAKSKASSGRENDEAKNVSEAESPYLLLA